MLAVLATPILSSALREDALREGFLPNYAARLLPPMEGSNTRPRLVPARGRNPVRVGVVADPALVTEARLHAVRSACGRWARAVTGLRFDFVRVRRPQDADVIFTFTRALPNRTLRGLTVERGGWASVALAVEDTVGGPLPLRTIGRVATHEIGHALGIWGHSPDPGDVMSIALDATEVSRADANTLRVAYLHPEPVPDALPFVVESSSSERNPGRRPTSRA